MKYIPGYHKPQAATPDNAPWGLYDTKDKCWMGDDTGPNLYDGIAVSFDVARTAEVITNEQFGYITRIRLCAYDGSGEKKKDDVTPKRSFMEALARVEGRGDQLPLEDFDA